MTTVTPTRDQKLRPKSGRKPLHPINSPLTSNPKPKAKQEWRDQIALNKENSSNHEVAAAKMETLDASLAEELSAIRKKMERLRLDRERTEKMLEERVAAMEAHMKEIQERGEIQKTLELEVDRLYRLNQLKSYCMRMSTIRTLREKEEDKRSGEGESKGKAAANPQAQAQAQDQDEEESVGENSPCPTPSPSSSTSTSRE